MDNILITICARGGSKGIPGKNIKLLNDKPLIQYTFELVEKLKKHFSFDIQLSTDDNKIKELVEKFNYKTNYLRPIELSGDKATKLSAIKDAYRFAEKHFKKEYDYVLDLDDSSPLRNVEDILKAFEIIKRQPDALNIFSVNHANRNPYFNQVELISDGYVQNIKQLDGIYGRQNTPIVYDINASFYIYSKTFMKGDYKKVVTNKSLVYVMGHICFDIDEKMDFEIMELLLKHNKLDFSL